MIKYLIHSFFYLYTLMLFVRIALSWFPTLYKYRFTHFIIFYTDPYLNLFRRIIPPIGGMLDISPILAFISLRFLENFIMRLLW